MNARRLFLIRWYQLRLMQFDYLYLKAVLYFPRKLAVLSAYFRVTASTGLITVEFTTNITLIFNYNITCHVLQINRTRAWQQHDTSTEIARGSYRREQNIRFLKPNNLYS
jgi:hypothetical protein